uniref:Uncharacterized protein n=1 Tax=Panagrolaimus sp. PS1159 TaxID=55785 RepID=A0AC35F021_9BILA
MVFHVGIDPLHGDVSYCNEYEKIIVDIEINDVEFNEYEKVALMFEEIKSKINGKLGYACICLSKYYGNEIRKNFIECGLKSGFKNVEIINWETAFYLNAMSQINYKP